MKYVKMLGLAAVAAMALAAFGASSASAVTLCTANEATCSAGNTIKEIHATQVGSGVLESGSTTLITCTSSTMLADQTKDGAGNNASGPVTKLTFSGCNTTPTVNSTGSLEINSKGEVKSIGGQITATIFGVACSYGTGAGVTLGTLKTGASATLPINAEIPKISGGFLCPSNAKWTATFQITNHSSVFVSAN
jgi:hypothetical protein